MAPKTMIDVSKLSFDDVVYDAEGLDTYLPQRFAMRQLHRQTRNRRRER